MTMPFSNISRWALLSLGLLLFCEISAADEPAVFQRPIRLRAENQLIDTGEAWGHSGPAVADVDVDGLLDLVVGDFSGKFRFYRNVGSRQLPRYAAATYLQAGAADAQVPIYCCIGSSPHFVDFDADGQLDFISGSYDPGECYLFRGKGAGKFADRETILDKTGKPILRRPDHKQKHASFGSWPVMVDWDNDGDLDLVIGAFDGEVFLRINDGTRDKPVFSDANILLMAGGKVLKVPGEPAGHAAPAIADWDNDGRWDLLCGSERGSVYFYRNVGEAGAPRFDAASEIISPHSGTGYEELIESDAEPVPGIRAQIAAVDYDNDGKVDLLLGDFCTNLSPRPGLTAAERDEMLKVLRERQTLVDGVRNAMDELRRSFIERFPGEGIYSDAADEAWDKEYQELRKRPVFTAFESKDKELQSSLAKYLLKPATGRFSSISESAHNHGYVWLFLRK